ncbi:MAG: AtpZ/AtpI family protein [Gemmataceae bacterium]|nr:AtpZ/AtpI family protein [Gemmataceae bacterium]MDW8242045.1 AtpZ/AtpI family protein [Thermogemmata sp.]
MPEQSRGQPASLTLLLAGSEMVSFTLAGLVADYLLGTLPLLTVILTVLGVPAAFWLLYRLSQGGRVERSQRSGGIAGPAAPQQESQG